MKIRNSGINPFLVNPVKAVMNNEDVGISHAYSTIDGIWVNIEYKDGKSGNSHIDNVEFLNKHEFERFKMMCKMLSKRYISDRDMKKLGLT